MVNMYVVLLILTTLSWKLQTQDFCRFFSHNIDTIVTLIPKAGSLALRFNVELQVAECQIVKRQNVENQVVGILCRHFKMSKRQIVEF
jgi:hypothetical protein